MDSNNFGWGSSGSPSSSKRGKRDKQRQPQRGLGVAQLEKIRIQSEMAEYNLPSIQSPFSNLNMSDTMITTSVSLAPSSIFAVRPNITMPLDGRDTFYSQAQTTSPTVRPLAGTPSNIYPPNICSHPTVTLPLFEGEREDYMRYHGRRWSTDTNSQKSDSSETQDLDLELKL
ncbi:hypothetical protein LUZ60_008180 [Juncus effusus]|nr:hypothetical protein LUZ60_008180 [Juncus effusus]